MKTKLTIIAMSILLSSNLIAQENEESSSDLNSPRSEFKHAIGACPIGVVLGDVLVTYEYLLNEAHGLAVMQLQFF